MPDQSSRVGALFAAGGGILLLWSGLTGKSWSKVLKSLVQGQNPATISPTQQIQGTPLSAFTQTGQAAFYGAAFSATSGSAPVSGGSNESLARMMAASMGWTGNEWSCLQSLWTRESGFNNRIWNGGSTAPTKPAGSSGAYGIPQALPYTKMPQKAWPPGYGGSADPRSQIEWGLGYIHGTYGSPCNAWAHEQSAGWY